MNAHNSPVSGTGSIVVSRVGGDEYFERWQRTAVAAFFRAEARGFVPGHELDDWLAAERELSGAPAPTVAANEQIAPLATPASGTPARRARKVTATQDAPAKAAPPAKAPASKKAATAKRAT